MDSNLSDSLAVAWPALCSSWLEFSHSLFECLPVKSSAAAVMACTAGVRAASGVRAIEGLAAGLLAIVVFFRLHLPHHILHFIHPKHDVPFLWHHNVDGRCAEHDRSRSVWLLDKHGDACCCGCCTSSCHRCCTVRVGAIRLARSAPQSCIISTEPCSTGTLDSPGVST